FVKRPSRSTASLPQRLTLRSRMFLPRGRSAIAELNLLQKENDGLRTEIIKLRHELTNKQGYAERLEVLLRERLERIDELTATIDQLRERNKRPRPRRRTWRPWSRDHQCFELGSQRFEH